MLTPQQLDMETMQLVEVYSEIEADLLAQTYKNLYENGIDNTNVLQWQLRKLRQFNLLTPETLKWLSEKSGVFIGEIENFLMDSGETVDKEAKGEMKAASKKKAPPLTPIAAVMTNYVRQAVKDVGNLINETMLTRNANNAVLKVLRNIINTTTAKVIGGVSTFDKALQDTVIGWGKSGFPSNFKDKAGKRWSVEAYARTTIKTTAHRTYTETRMERMKDFDIHLVRMSSHAASRKECSKIQGKVISMLKPSDKDYDGKYPSIWNYGYKEPGGTQGINCTHILTPFIEGANTNNEKPIPPKEAERNGKIQQRQRAIERAIRKDKKALNVAEKIGAEEQATDYKQRIRKKQAGLRQLVSEHDFLIRDYGREKVFDK